jgi:penicillin-binding protein 2
MDGGLGPSGKRRLKLAALAGFSAFSLLGWRFHQLQIEQHPLHVRNARLNTVVVERTMAARGRIVDAKGRPIVINEPTYQLWVRPGELKAVPKLLPVLAHTLGQPEAAIASKIKRATGKAPLEPLVLQRSLDSKQLARAAVSLRNIPGVYLEATSRRRYLWGKSGAGFLGYMGEISEAELEDMRKKKQQDYSARDMVGKSGLEAQYDPVLRGRKGVENHSVDARGRTVRVEEGRPAVPGGELHLTVDMGLQQLAEKLLMKTIKYPHGGAVVILDPRNGRVKALASAPTFDPRPFAKGISARQYNSLLSDPSTPLLSRAFEAAFSPGSTFKPMTLSSGLSEGLCSSGTILYCGGNYKGQNCFVTSGHGHISVRDTIAHSCSAVYYRMADQMGIDKLAKYAKAFGFGQKTGIDLPHEDTGLLPNRYWKRKVWGDDWYAYDTMNMGIGQGMLVVTPLQMAVMTATIANGGNVYKPILVDKIRTGNGGLRWRSDPKPVRRVPVKPEHLKVVREGMAGAVDHGTAGAAAVPGIKVAAKTGTVETNGANHTWFVSFAPADNPRLVVVVFVEKSGGYGGSVAAPIAGELYKYYFKVKPDAKQG